MQLVLGGSFDPVHRGHVHLLEGAKRELNADRASFMPCRIPPHKQGLVASDEHRVAMLKLLLNPDNGFEIDTREIEADPAAPSYSYHSLQSLRLEASEQSSINFLIGWDSYVSLSTWFRWQELFTFVNIVVARRPHCSETIPSEVHSFVESRQVAPSELKNHSAGKLAVLKLAEMDVSSTAIRLSLSNDGPASRELDRYLPASVLEYIQQNTLYAP